jgi:hypothetical protein
MRSNFQYASEANQQAAQALQVYSVQLKKLLENPKSLTGQEAVDHTSEYWAVEEQLRALPTASKEVL